MGAQFPHLPDHLRQFAEKQHMFFVGSAADGKVNITPKGFDAIRFLSKRQLIWYNFTGSTNETASHVMRNPRMTIMFTAFKGDPLILRIFGQAKIIHKDHEKWREYIPLFDAHPAIRQLFFMDIELVTTSCGMGVPEMDFLSSRADHQLRRHFDKKSEAYIHEYQQRKNLVNLDGENTDIKKDE